MEKQNKIQISEQEIQAMEKLGITANHISNLIERFGVEKTKEYINDCLSPKDLDQHYGKPIEIP